MYTAISKVASVLLLAALTANAQAQQAVTMQAVVMQDGKVSLREVTRPTAKAGEVLVKIRAAGVHPIHWKMASGYSGPPRASNAPIPAGAPSMPPANSAPRVVGADYAGVVAAVGSGVTTFKVGDAVIANSGEGYAEYAVAKAEDVVLKPSKLSFAEAAALPGVAVTVWNSIVDVANIKVGQKILIHGAAGGTGSSAVQIAKARGAYVIGTASARNHDYLRSIGADQVIDYNTERFEDRVSNVDVVLNTANLETATRSIKVVKKGGYLMSIAGIPDEQECAAAGITCAVRDMESPTSSPRVMQEILQLVQAGKYSVNVDKTFPLSAYQQAWDYGKLGHTRGKIVLTVGN
ncbi:MAG: NADP-dependent oxidoreductase [Steroidobacteraceae bacterium]